MELQGTLEGNYVHTYHLGWRFNTVLLKMQAV